MSFSSSATIVIVIMFLIFNTVVSIYYGSNTKTIRGYTVSDRKFSTLSIIVSIIASIFSGCTFYFIILYILQGGIWPTAFLAYSFSLFIQGHFIIPKMHQLLGKLSIAEVMGNLYGRNIRIIAAIVSIIFSILVAAMEIKLILYLVSDNFFNIIFITALVTIAYSSFWSIRTVLMTNMLHCFAFCTIIPLCLLVIWSRFSSLYSISDIFSLVHLNSIHNNYELIANKYYYLLIYYLLPILHPTVFHRVLMSSSVRQLTLAFKTLAFVVLIVTFLSILIAALLLPIVNNLTIGSNSNIFTYMSHIYQNNQFVTLIVIAIIIMAISTTSSFVHTASVITFHDLCKPIGLFKNNNSIQELHITRVLNIICIIISVIISILYKGPLLDLHIIGEHFYLGIIGAALLIMSFRIRSSETTILISMATGTITTIAACYYNQSLVEIRNILIAVVISLIVAIVVHYVLPKSNQYQRILPKSKLYVYKKERYYPFKNKIVLLRYFFQWDTILTYSDQFNTLKHQRYYFYSSLFTILSLTIMSMLTTMVRPISDFKLVFILLIIAFVVATTFITRHSLPFMCRHTRYIGILWHMFIFHSLIITNTALLVISCFDSTALVCFLLNLLVVAILIKWMVALVMIVMGMSLAMLLLLSCQPDLGYLTINTRSVVSLTIIIVMLTIILLFFIKTEQDEYVFESKMRTRAESRVRDINSLLDIKKNIINNLSHEVRAPLHGVKAGINLLTSYLHRYSECNSELLQMVSLANNSVERLCNYIDNLLDLSKFEANKMIFNIQLCNLKVLLDEIIVDFNILHVSKDHYIKIQHYTQQDIKLYCDHNRIKQVMFNLISNAIKYSKSGVIMIKASKKQHHIYVAVEDEGNGIPEDELESIFQPFVQSRCNQSQVGSTGLGLNLCREIIAYHNGKIWAENRKEGGARFTFFLPIIEANKLPIACSAPIANKYIPENVKDIQTRILFIDDDQSMLDSIRLFTYNTGYQVTTLTSGSEAIKHIISHSTQYDIIFLDISLPDKNAIMILQEVQNVLQQYQIPVIIQSGYYGDEALKQELISLGVKDFITKPYSQATFLQHVVSVIKDT